MRWKRARRTTRALHVQPTWRWDRAISTASRTVSACRATSRTRRGRAERFVRAPSGAAIGRGRGERSTAPRSAFVYRARIETLKLGRLTAQESSLFVPLAFHHFLPFAAFSERCARVSRGENFLSLGDLETRAAEGVAAFSSALFGVFF